MAISRPRLTHLRHGHERTAGLRKQCHSTQKAIVNEEIYVNIIVIPLTIDAQESILVRSAETHKAPLSHYVTVRVP